MTAPHLRRGQRAEGLARRFLQTQGLRLIEKNFRCRTGELDLVMHDGDALVIVETRYRANARTASPFETIDRNKRRRIALATRFFLSTHSQWANAPVRFDVVSVEGAIGAPRIDWIRNAFTAEDL